VQVVVVIDIDLNSKQGGSMRNFGNELEKAEKVEYGAMVWVWQLGFGMGGIRDGRNMEGGGAQK
jgi:hypothetical protein